MEIGVPETSMTPPGASLWPATANWEAALAVNVVSTHVKTGNAGTGFGAACNVFRESRAGVGLPWIWRGFRKVWSWSGVQI